MDILKYGKDCKVLEPPALIEKVIEQFKRGLERYS